MASMSRKREFWSSLPKTLAHTRSTGFLSLLRDHAVQSDKSIYGLAKAGALCANAESSGFKLQSRATWRTKGRFEF